ALRRVVDDVPADHHADVPLVDTVVEDHGVVVVGGDTDSRHGQLLVASDDGPLGNDLRDSHRLLLAVLWPGGSARPGGGRGQASPRAMAWTRRTVNGSPEAMPLRSISSHRSMTAL